MNTDRIIQALIAGIENTQELLAIHERDLGRTIVSNRLRAEAFEDEIENMEDIIRELKEQSSD